jgi:TolB-like protein/class 3 adenylate cyclase/Flp pilus assembly protein TadD
MADHGGGRRLAAILAADVVGYSRLMAADEAGTHARLKALRKGFIEPKIAEHHGRLVKLTGDGALVEFASVLDAVACAVEIQRGTAERNAEIAADDQIRFRIGVNLGDVIFDEDDLYGDGVNVAARLEALAEPGSVCISAKVHDEVKNKLGFGYQDLGPQAVKNLPEPVRAYRVLTEPGAKSTAAAGGRRHIAWRLSIIAAAIALVVIGAGIIGWRHPWQSSGGMAAASLDPHRVAVLPFVNISTDAAEEYFSDGMTEEMITQLSKIGRLSVIARTSIMKYKGTKEDIAEIGRTLQVGTIIEGSVRKAGNQVRITAQLIDVPTQAHLWSEDYDRALADVFAIQSDIAKQVAEELEITLLAKEQAQIEKQHAIDLEAHNLYLRGLYFYNQGGVAWEKSRTYFEEAIQRDPSYAMAYARLADLYTKMWWSMPHQDAYAKARAAAEKALELDDSLAEAHSALAIVRLYADWDWPGAEREFQKAIALNPSSALAHADYGHKLLSAVMGRYDDALAEVRRAQELDPLSVTISTQMGMVYRHARRWDQSNAQFQRTLELGSKSPWPHDQLAHNYAALGRYNDAIAAEDQAVALAGNSPYFQGVRGWILGLAGRTDEAQQMLRELEKTAAGQKVDPVAFAYIYLGLGDNDHAIAWLQKAYQEHSTEMIYLRTPSWDSLRSDPRFITLMKDVGLPSD